MRIPQDIANLLAIAIRDIIWYKDNVRSFLKECGVDAGLLAEMPRITPTLKLVHHVLNRLDSIGAAGEKPVKAMLTRIYYWKDLHSIPAERKDQALASLKELQKAYKIYLDQQKYQQEQEIKMQDDRVVRTAMKPLDHAKLQAFREEFDLICAVIDPQARGNRYQDLLNKIFDYYADESKGSFKRTGEQVDGLFYFDKHWWYVEVRWKSEKTLAADVSILRDRAKNAFGGDTKALFISFNGYTVECLESLKGKTDERVVLMDGYDLRCVLDCQIAFDVLLAEKQAELVQYGRPFVSASDIINRRCPPV
jgi:hypothetical protein